VHGNERTVRSVIARQVKLQQGQVFDQKRLRDAEERLYELGLFDRVSILPRPSTASADEADVDVEVTERPAGRVRFGGGYGTWDQLRGQVQASYANLFGRGIQVDARALASFRGYEVGAGLRDPAILGTRLRFALDTYYQDRD